MLIGATAFSQQQPAGGFWTSVAPAKEDSTSAVVISPWLSRYRFKVVAHWALAGFQNLTYNDKAWLLGYGGFGNSGPTCTLNSKFVNTHWAGSSDVLLRRAFNLPVGFSGVRIQIAVDNGAQVYVNGHDVSGGMKTRNGCAARPNFTFTVPNSYVHSGQNLLAIRAMDKGGLCYVDAQVIRQ